jgi:hypothetical protein
MVVFSGILLISVSPAWAELQGTYKPEIYYVGVDGDSDKFKARHWMGTGLEAGVGEYEFKDEKSWQGAQLEMKGHGLADNADYLHEFSLKKEDVGELIVSYQQFRKYFDSQGGTYKYFSELSTNDSGRDLYVDVGRLETILIIERPDLPKLEFGYEHEFKSGTKSLLGWGSARQGAVTKKIAPTWWDIDEEVNKFDIKLEHHFSGFEFKADQTWEHSASRNMREMKYLADASVATEERRLIRDQYQDPKSDLVQTVFHLDKWFFKDKLYASTGYRYSQIENSELENMYEYNEYRVIKNFQRPEQVRGATATNQLSSNTFVANLMAVISKTLTAGGKLKFEEISRNGQSTHPLNNLPAAAANAAVGVAPGESIDQIDVSNSSDRVIRWGEGFSLRYTGIEKTALYNEVELEQTFGGLNEDRQSISTSEQFNRETDYYFYRFSETLGAQIYPADWMNLTTQYRFRKDNLDYDDQTETISTATGAKSAFVDGGLYQASEFTLRTTFYPESWLQPSFRYQLKFLENTWYTEGDPLRVTSETVSNVYTANLMFRPADPLTLNAYFSIQDMWTGTAASSAAILPYPRFNADVATWMFSADYALNSKTTLNSSFQYQHSSNYNDFSTITLPYGQQYNEYNVTFGMTLMGLVKEVTVEPKYSFYRYDPNEELSLGKYDAHIVWLSATMKWG